MASTTATPAYTLQSNPRTAIRTVALGPLMTAVAFLYAALAGQASWLIQLAYRYDEVWRVHSVVERGPLEAFQYMTLAINPPLFRMILSGWVGAFGHQEVTTGYLTVLLTLLMMAVTYRHAADLFGHIVARWTVLVLMLVPHFVYYTLDVGVYALLPLMVVSTSWLFLRWIKRPHHRGYALAYAAVGIAGMYTHYFVGYLVVAQALFVLLVLRWNIRHYAFAFWMFAGIAIAFGAGWGPIILHRLVTHAAGVTYAYQFQDGYLQALLNLFEILELAPIAAFVAMGALAPIALTAPNAKPHPLLRFGANWRRLFPLLMFFGLFFVAMLVNEYSRALTSRNLIIFTPFAAMLAGLGLGGIPRAMRLALLVVLLAVNYDAPPERLVINRDHVDAGSFTDFVAPHLVEDAVFLVDSTSPRDFMYWDYFIRERLPARQPAERLLWLGGSADYYTQGGELVRPYPKDEFVAVEVESPNAAARITEHIADHEQVWYLATENAAFTGTVEQNLLRTHYLRTEAQHAFSDTIREYRPLPSDLTPRARFDGALVFNGWHLPGGAAVRPCESVTLQTWWRAEAPLPYSYSLSASVLGADGQPVANVDTGIASIISTLWFTDRYYYDERSLTIPCDQPAGAYPLIFVVHPSATDEASSVTAMTGEALDAVVYLTNVEVQP